MVSYKDSNVFLSYDGAIPMPASLEWWMEHLMECFRGKLDTRMTPLLKWGYCSIY